MSLKRNMIITILAMSFLCVNCQKSPTDQGEEQPEIVDVSSFSIENYPRVDGSTSAHPLQMIIACNILGVPYQWTDWTDETRRAYPMGSRIPENNYIQQINHNGTHGSYVNLLIDSTDIIIVAREPSTDELYLADSLGVILKLQEIALDAFVFILNIENPVNNLTVDQIRNIYTGNLINWREVGGLEAGINPYQRNRNSGSQELMENLVMQEVQMIESPQMVLTGMMGPIHRLVSDPYGLGYTVYFFNNYMAPREKIKLCSINGVQPNFENLSDGKYIFTTKVFVVIRSDLDEDSPAFILWRWLQTEEGQKVVGESGYIPINLN